MVMRKSCCSDAYAEAVELASAKYGGRDAFAYLTGISRSTLWNRCSGRVKLTVEAVLSMAHMIRSTDWCCEHQRAILKIVKDANPKPVKP